MCILTLVFPTITIENEIYRKLGPHPRLIRIVGWDPEDCVLNMEYMPNGNLQTFLIGNDTVAETQRLQWVQEAAEGVQLLHDADVLHCDINPKNFLLDAHLGLKIANFGGSSLEGSKRRLVVENGSRCRTNVGETHQQWKMISLRSAPLCILL